MINDAVTLFNKDSAHSASVALIGGYAAVYFGSERTTFDVDICFHSKDNEPGRTFFDFLKRELPSNLKPRLFEDSKDPTDPLKHDIITISDSEEKYPRIDILVIRYKWELEGLEHAITPKKLSFPVIPAPEEELIKTRELAKKLRKDRKLQALLKEGRPDRGKRKSSSIKVLSWNTAFSFLCATFRTHTIQPVSFVSV